MLSATACNSSDAARCHSLPCLTSPDPHACFQVFLVERLDAAAGEAMLHIKVRFSALRQTSSTALASRRGSKDQQRSRLPLLCCAHVLRLCASCGLLVRTSPLYVAICASRNSESTISVRARVASFFRCDSLHSLTASILGAVFTNVLKDSFLHELADADDGEIIKQVQVRDSMQQSVGVAIARSC